MKQENPLKPKRFSIRPGMQGRKVMPHSEVCMHMQIAGKYMDFRLLRSAQGYVSVQLYFPDDGDDRWTRRYSGPITTGEAGIFLEIRGDTLRHYYYPHETSLPQPMRDPIADMKPEWTIRRPQRGNRTTPPQADHDLHAIPAGSDSSPASLGNP